MVTVYKHPYTCRFWYPFNVDYEDATYSLEVKAPEIGNKEIFGRNQIFARTKSGNTIVADFGRVNNNTLKLNFKSIPDVERSAMVVFLNAVSWGLVKLKYRDYLGVERVVRVNTNSIDSSDTGFRNRDDNGSILWDFDLDILDVTDNINEQDGVLVPTALALHLADFNSPHNPKVSISIAAETKTVEEFSVGAWNMIAWIVLVKKAGKYASFLVHGLNDGTTNVDFVSDLLCNIGGAAADVTFAVDISSGSMRLRATSSVAGPYTIEARRIKL